MRAYLVRSSTVRLGIFISTLIVAVLIIFQLAWLRKVYLFEQKGFDRSVIKSVKGLYEDLSMPGYQSVYLDDLIRVKKNHTYIARMKWPVNYDSLVHALRLELEDFDVYTTCQLDVYHAPVKQITFTRVFSVGETGNHTPRLMPPEILDYDYIRLYFPDRRKFILSEMNFWIISSGIILVVLLGFSTSFYFFYRQKFLAETQKDFIQNFTHEFKTPVSVLNLAAEVLQEDDLSTKPGKLATYAGIVRKQVSYLQDQTDKLLRFSYAEGGKMHLDKQPVQVHSLVAEAVDNLAPLIESKQAVIRYNFQARNPVVIADRGYLLIVLTNLVDNAVKYSRHPVIDISTRNDAGKMVIAVSDNGIGIGKPELKKMFRKFYRIPSGEVYSTKGFGIGLAFVKKIITAHNGKITVKSREGQGSTFIITLPGPGTME